MYEVIWDVSASLEILGAGGGYGLGAELLTGEKTTPFNDPDLWPEDTTQQPFVWSTGDE
jgi:hypothetical protein